MLLLRVDVRPAENKHLEEPLVCSLSVGAPASIHPAVELSDPQSR